MKFCMAIHSSVYRPFPHFPVGNVINLQLEGLVSLPCMPVPGGAGLD
ncbi:hypothetical protein J2X29_003727 [Shewanella putrefaciens]|nr:hypothetical protein [Shewanella putrefaciens]